MSNWILQAARKQSGKQITLSLAALGIVTMLLLSNIDYVREYFRGAHEVSASDLKTSNPQTAGWISLKANKVHNTGLQEITVRKKRGIERSRSVSAVYFIAEVGTQYVLVKGDEGQTTALKGTFEPMNSEIAEQIFKDPQMQEMRPLFYPLVMNTHDYDNEASTWLPVGGLVALGALIWGGIGFMRFRKPETHPAVKPFVAAGTLDAAGKSMARSLKEKSALKLGNSLVTPQYVVTQGWLKLDIKLLDELLWAFKVVTQKKLYYIIPAGKTYSASLNFEKGTLLLGGKEKKVDDVLEFVAERAPWASFGHDDGMAQVYKKQRASLVEHVQQRKAEIVKFKALKATPAEALTSAL
jgi:hypothetical protein